MLFSWSATRELLTKTLVAASVIILPGGLIAFVSYKLVKKYLERT